MAADANDWLDRTVSVSRTLPWRTAQFLIADDWAQERRLLSYAKSNDGLLIAGLSVVKLESLFKLRALQILDNEGRQTIPVVVVLPSGEGHAALPRFGDRVKSGWPFGSILFIGDAGAVTFLKSEGLPAIDFDEAKQSTLRELFKRENRALAATPAPKVAVLTQPMWLYTGSTTVFANQIDALLDRGFFIVRVFIEHDVRAGPALQQRLERLLPESNVDAAPHIETFACPTRGVTTIESERADEAYLASICRRMRSRIVDDVIMALAKRASLAMVNYANNVPFIFGACPEARVVLEAHDDITRHVFERARLRGDDRAFPTLSSVKRHLRLERWIWRSVDACVSLSSTELHKMQRYCAPCFYVIPSPYVRRSTPPPGRTMQWDILIVANLHQFNVQSVDWFLERIVSPDERLMGLRIAVVGRVQEKLQSVWQERLPGVHWLGYVKNLDDLRAVSRLSVCPDLAGTGIAIKTLTALAAGHPLVATGAALRGLGDDIFRIIPIADSAKDMREQIAGLLDNDTLLDDRRRQVSAAYAQIQRQTSHKTVLSLVDDVHEDRSAARKNLLTLLQPGVDTFEQEMPLVGDEVLLDFASGGNAGPFLGHGWHDEESGGRWTDGASGQIYLPAAWLRPRSRIEIAFSGFGRNPGVALKHQGCLLPVASRKPGRLAFEIDMPVSDPPDDYVALEISTSSVFCPAETGTSADARTLGVHVTDIRIMRNSIRANRVSEAIKKLCRPIFRKFGTA